MKKLFLFAFVVTSLIFTSCSSDDSPAQEQDQIIGKWAHVQEFMNGVDYPLHECVLKGSITFDVDGTYTQEAFEDSQSNGTCTIIIDSNSNGTWSNDGNGSYTITVGTVVSTHKYTFEGDTYSITSDNGIDVFKSIFKRI